MSAAAAPWPRGGCRGPSAAIPRRGCRSRCRRGRRPRAGRHGTEAAPSGGRGSTAPARFGDALDDPVGPAAGSALGAEALASFADAERQPVAAGEIVVVAGAAGDVSVAREDLVIEQQLAEFRFRGVDLWKVVRADRGRQVFRTGGRQGGAQKEGKG